MKSKMVGTVVRLGQKDFHGDIIHDVWFEDGQKVPVNIDFHGPEIGEATLKLHFNEVVAEVEFDDGLVPATHRIPAIGGRVHQRNGNNIDLVEITMIALVTKNADAGIKRLQPVLREVGAE